MPNMAAKINAGRSRGVTEFLKNSGPENSNFPFPGAIASSNRKNSA